MMQGSALGRPIQTASAFSFGVVINVLSKVIGQLDITFGS